MKWFWRLIIIHKNPSFSRFHRFHLQKYYILNVFFKTCKLSNLYFCSLTTILLFFSFQERFTVSGQWSHTQKMSCSPRILLYTTNLLTGEKVQMSESSHSASLGRWSSFLYRHRRLPPHHGPKTDGSNTHQLPPSEFPETPGGLVQKSYWS